MIKYSFEELLNDNSFEEILNSLLEANASDEELKEALEELL